MSDLWELLRQRAVLDAAWDKASEGGWTDEAEAARLAMRSTWDIAMCAAGGRVGDGDDIDELIESLRAPDCWPTALTRDTRDRSGEDGALLFMGACLGCGWVSGIEHDMWDAGENGAVEDASEHGFPGFRDLPAFAVPYSDSPEKDKRIQRLAAQAAEIYPPGWRERRGPTWSWRRPMGTRHVPGRGLFGGYDLGRLRAEQEEQPEESQMELFA